MAPAQNKPSAELAVDSGLVRDLLQDQHPDLAHLIVVEVAEGWDNVVFRLGDELCVRLPRRAVAAEIIANEQRWLPDLAPALPLPVPAPVRTGRPGCGYPWVWSIVPWFDGAPLGTTTPADPGRFATDLGRFLAALHRRAPATAPENELRGIPLDRRSASFAAALGRLGDEVDAAEASARWERVIRVPGPEAPPVWVHGDVHPLNLLVDDAGVLTAVIDFGDLNAGDPATDLAIAWTAIDAPDRARFRASCAIDGRPVDDATWTRAWGWALNFSIVYLANSADVPVLLEIGRLGLDRVLADPQV